MLEQFRSHQGLLDHADPSIAQIALRFGANDLDGTVVEKDLPRCGRKDIEFTSLSELERLIRAAGRVPVDAHALHPVDRSKLPPSCRPRRRASSPSH